MVPCGDVLLQQPPGEKAYGLAAVQNVTFGPFQPRHSATFESALRGSAAAPPVSWRGSR
jgi:hypothetical protein